MMDVRIEKQGRIAVVTMRRGKVNALDDGLLMEMMGALDAVDADDDVQGMVLTGAGSFFSFGFDVPATLTWTRDRFVAFLTTFTELYTRLYLAPRPVIAALNGHTIAGGCILALAADERVMAEGRTRIGMNEITLGSAVPAGSLEMLRACVGQRNAERIAGTGTLYDAAQARALGLVDVVAAGEQVLEVALERARALAAQPGTAFSDLKLMLRGPVAEVMRAREPESTRAFAENWCSPEMRERLKGVEIR